MTRLNKYLSEMGVCSRREADRLIEAGLVLVDGKMAQMGMKIEEGQQVICDGRLIGGTGGKQKDEPVLVAVNKPRGIVCTTSDKDRAENIVEFIKYPVRIYPVGRLDKDSEGLILMTNEGGLVNQLMRAANGHEREYAVRVNKPITDSFIKSMGAGMYLPELDASARPCKVWGTGTDTFRIVLTQGLNRQIRRMCQSLGYRVVELRRERILNIHLGNLKTGEFRKVTPEEQEQLWKMLDR